MTAAYLINRLPSSTLSFETPYELLFHKAPSYEHLKVFSCLPFMNTLKQARSKFDPRAQPCVFLGYPAAKKAYKVYNLVTKKIHFSRDLVFYEQHFPFHYYQSSDVVLPNFLFSPSSTPDYPPLSTRPPLSAVTPQPEISPFPTQQSLSPSTSSSSLSSPSPLPPRRIARISKPPYLKDYVCPSKVQPSTSNSHWCNLVQFSALSFVHQQSIHHLDFLHEPHTYKEAALHPHWVQAMQAEIDALILNKTWTEVDLPHGKKAISSKWVFKIKLKADGSLERYKARLVVRGNTQKEGIDYIGTFLPCGYDDYYKNCSSFGSS